MNLAIIGATGNVGRKTIEILEKSKIQISNLFLVASSKSEGKKIKFESDVALISVGRKPYTKNLNLEKVGIELDEKKRIKVSKNYQTNIKNIYAIGDVIEGPMLAHKAEEEGIAVAELISGQSGHVNYEVIPGVIYTTPEVASVGKTEEQLKEKNQKYAVQFMKKKFEKIKNPNLRMIYDIANFYKNSKKFKKSFKPRRIFKYN